MYNKFKKSWKTREKRIIYSLNKYQNKKKKNAKIKEDIFLKNKNFRAISLFNYIYDPY